MMSKLFTSIGHEKSESEKDTLQKIFHTIDTDGTGSCSIDELTVSTSLSSIRQIRLTGLVLCRFF
jgi:Ca2+-binding EF-hand superfamily protein